MIGRLFIAGVAVPLATFVVYGQGAEESTAMIVLSCDGRETVCKGDWTTRCYIKAKYPETKAVNRDKNHRETTPVSKMGIVVNLSAQTVAGFDGVAQIEQVDAAHIKFGTYEKKSGKETHINGIINRLTGAVSAETTVTWNEATSFTSVYDLICKPTRPLF